MAAYPKPSGNTGTFNNSSFNNAGNTGGLTVEEGLKYFVSYPTTQSPSTIVANNLTTTGALNVSGTSQFGGDATFVGGATITGPLTFADNVEVQGTTTLDDTLLCLTTVNIDGELTCNGGILMTPQAPGTNSIIDFVNAGGEVQLYLDPTTTYDMVFQSSQSEGTAGLSIVNATSSFTFQCSTITTGVVGMKTLNPINMNGWGLYGLTNLYNNGNTTTPIISLNTGTISFNNGSLNQIGTMYIGNNAGTNYSTIYQNGFNLSLVNNTPYSGGGTNNINFSLNNSVNSLVTPITIYPTSVSLSTQLNMNNQSIISATMGTGVVATTQGLGNSTTALATTQFVQNAIGSIGGGVSLSGDNVWTNFNNFNVNAGAFNTKSYVYGLTPVWNMTPSPTGGNGDCSLIANTGVGSMNNAFQIYCVGVDTVSSTLASSTPQLTLSNNGYPMQVKDGINIPTGETYTVNGVNILNNTNLLGNPTAITQPVNTNNTTLATTAFVTSNGPIYTTSSFTNNGSLATYIAITPSPCSVISTYIAQTNVVYFNNVNFTVSVTGNPLFLIYLCVLVFNVNPFPNSPPNPTTGYINVLFNNTNTIYTSSYVWTVNTLTISWPSGLTNYANTTFTINLQNLGAFQA
jgi:hypothetical protein